MTAGIQQGQRNLSKYSFGATGRRNQSHKNRTLNRVPLNQLFEPYRHGHSTAERALRGHTVFTRLQFRLNKVMLHFQPVLTTVFLNDTWYPHTPNAPLYHHSTGDTLEEGHAWEGGRGGEGGWEMDEWCFGDMYEGVRRQGCTSLSSQHTRLSPSVCGRVRFTFHLVGDSRSESLSHISNHSSQSSSYAGVSQAGVLVKHLINLFFKPFRQTGFIFIVWFY